MAMRWKGSKGGVARRTGSEECIHNIPESIDKCLKFEGRQVKSIAPKTSPELAFVPIEKS